MKRITTTSDIKTMDDLCIPTDLAEDTEVTVLGIPWKLEVSKDKTGAEMKYWYTMCDWLTPQQLMELCTYLGMTEVTESQAEEMIKEKSKIIGGLC